MKRVVNAPTVTDPSTRPNAVRSIRARRSNAARRGRAALAMIVSSFVVAGLSLALLTTSLRNTTVAIGASYEAELHSAAEDAVQIAVTELWGAIEREHRDRTLPLDEARAALTGIGLVPDGPPLDLLPNAGLPLDDGQWRLADVNVERMVAERSDHGTRTVVRVQVTTRVGAPDGNFDALVHHDECLFELERAPWSGSSFAVVTRDLGGATAPLAVDSAPRVLNRDPQFAGSFDHVRVAGLGVLHAPDRAFVAGSLYLGGGGFDGDGRPIRDWSRLALDAVRLDGRGRIVERTNQLADDGSFAIQTRLLLPWDPRQARPFESLYLEQSDAQLRAPIAWPTSFPPVPEADLASEPGRLSVARVRGRVVASGQRYAATDPVPDLAAPVSSSLDDRLVLEGRVEGSLVALGTPSDPVRIDGDVVIEGDLVIGGTVTGLGRLLVRGAVLVPIDLVYTDGVEPSFGGRTLGRSPSGSSNGLAIAAGGVVALGSPTTTDGEVRAGLRAAAVRRDDVGGAPFDREFALAPTSDWSTPQDLASLGERLASERARWKPFEVDAALFSATAIVGSVDPAAVGLSGGVMVVGSLASERLIVDAPSGLRVLFDPRAPQLLDLRDPDQVRLRRSPATAPATPRP